MSNSHCIIVLVAFLTTVCASMGQGQNLVRSGPPSPAGTTNYDISKQYGAQVVKLVGYLVTKAVDHALATELEKMGEDIRKQMPAKGGILMIAWIAEEK